MTDKSVQISPAEDAAIADTGADITHDYQAAKSKKPLAASRERSALAATPLPRVERKD